ncbi:MAG: hypothetical protein FJ276_34190, partial [Planctomycetes bacterium]|nr:hypothetical protein [Planctomycetota bacterium]
MNGWRRQWCIRGAAALTIGLLSCRMVAIALAEDGANALQAMVQSDWEAQEVRLGRTAGSPTSIREALRRAGLLLDDLRARADGPALATEVAALERLRTEADRAAGLDADARLRLYYELRGLARDVALKNPLITARPILFMKRDRFPCQMLHEYIAYFNQYSGAFGGGVYVLEEPGRSLKIRDAIAGRLPPGCYSSLALSYDARTALFAFAERGKTKPVLGSPDQRYYHLYYFDRFGNLELLYRDPAIASTYPIPLSPRRAPPVLPSTLDPALGDQGELLLSDVSQGHFPLPKDRPIRSLRIFQVLPKTTPTANQPRIGHANAESARMLLGTAPVEADGSAWFRVPARKPLYFQAVDAEGRAVQTMRSIVYLQPGERRSCVGCHEPRAAAPERRNLAALTRGPAVIQPGPDGTRPFSYPRLVQPVLDRHCQRCHDGTPGTGKSGLVLTGEADGLFTRSYNNLKPYLRWYEWGGASITQAVTYPGRSGADESRLTKILADATHASLALPPQDRDRLLIWLDGNVPFYGTYDQEQQRQQRGG